MATSDMTWVNLFVNEDLLLSEFITNLRTRIDEDTEDVISDSQITIFVENGLLDIHRKTWMNVGYATDDADGSDYYILPSGMSKVELVVYIDSAGNEQILIDSNEHIREDIASSSTQPMYYERRGNRIYLYGNPTSGTLKVCGSKAPTIPTSISSYIDIPYQDMDLLYAYVEYQYWKRRRVPDEAQLARQIYQELAEDVRQEIVEQLGKGFVVHG